MTHFVKRVGRFSPCQGLLGGIVCQPQPQQQHGMPAPPNIKSPVKHHTPPLPDSAMFGSLRHRGPLVLQRQPIPALPLRVVARWPQGYANRTAPQNFAYRRALQAQADQPTPSDSASSVQPSQPAQAEPSQQSLVLCDQSTQSGEHEQASLLYERCLSDATTLLLSPAQPQAPEQTNPAIQKPESDMDNPNTDFSNIHS